MKPDEPDTPRSIIVMVKIIAWFEELSKADLGVAGGKGANLGEMTQAGIPVPPGFVVTAQAYEHFIKSTGLYDSILSILKETDVDISEQLQSAGERIRKMIKQEPILPEIKQATIDAYNKLSEKTQRPNVHVAVRSSATAEDLPDASFAGQQDTYLNIHGNDQLIQAVQSCWASLFTNRAIFYREKNKFDHSKVLISVIVQEMVNSESAGVIFTIHPTTSNKNHVYIESAWGLGESVVSGSTTPDNFTVDKNTLQIVDKLISTEKKEQRIRDPNTGNTIEVSTPLDKVTAQSISDNNVKELAKIAKTIEDHYQFPQDIEWALERGKLYIVQSRPVTAFFGEEGEKKMEETEEPAEVILKGLGASPGTGIGPVQVVLDAKDIGTVKEGEVLVTKMTNPDWVPAMKKAVAIVTDDGGMTCHAAIVSREMGTPCIVGSHEATTVLKEYQGKDITVDGTRGVVYAGARKVKEEEVPAVAGAAAPPVTGTKIYVNLSLPELARKVAAQTQADGIGLLRAEHMLLGIGKHPRKLIEEGGGELMVNSFAEDLRTVCEAFYPKPVVYRFLDFKPDEFLGLEGGEVEEELGHVGPNPLIGFRGAFRYRKEPDIFRLECQAIKKVREEYGLKNLWVMIPFCRTLEDLTVTYQIMKEEGLERNRDFKLWIMVEVPSTCVIIDKFIDAGIDGVSFGSNDLTMLVLGLDRDDASIQELYDERDLAVLRMIKRVIDVCNKRGVTTSVCGQAPSVYESFAEFLVRIGATSMSVNPDTVVYTRKLVASIERKITLEKLQGMDRSDPDWDMKID